MQYFLNYFLAGQTVIFISLQSSTHLQSRVDVTVTKWLQTFLWLFFEITAHPMSSMARHFTTAVCRSYMGAPCYSLVAEILYKLQMMTMGNRINPINNENICCPEGLSSALCYNILHIFCQQKTVFFLKNLEFETYCCHYVAYKSWVVEV
jgi:hypothetical protein